jgi:hypothetical protein
MLLLQPHYARSNCCLVHTWVPKSGQGLQLLRLLPVLLLLPYCCCSAAVAVDARLGSAVANHGE